MEAQLAEARANGQHQILEPGTVDTWPGTDIRLRDRAVDLLQTERVVSSNGRVVYPAPEEMFTLLADALKPLQGFDIRFDAAFSDITEVGDKSVEDLVHRPAQKIAIRGRAAGRLRGSRTGRERRGRS